MRLWYRVHKETKSNQEAEASTVKPHHDYEPNTNKSAMHGRVSCVRKDRDERQGQPWQENHGGEKLVESWHGDGQVPMVATDEFGKGTTMIL